MSIGRNERVISITILLKEHGSRIDLLRFHVRVWALVHVPRISHLVHPVLKIAESCDYFENPFSLYKNVNTVPSIV